MTLTMDPEGVETRILHELVDFRDRDVLEVGCGDGRMTWRFAERARSVLGIDPDASQIERARRDLPEALRGKVRFRVSDITEIDLPRERFDIAVLSWSI